MPRFSQPQPPDLGLKICADGVDVGMPVVAVRQIAAVRREAGQETLRDVERERIFGKQIGEPVAGEIAIPPSPGSVNPTSKSPPSMA